MAPPGELLGAKTKLFEALGNDSQRYLKEMKLWFSRRITREEFDGAVRKFMSREATILHNEFLLALLDRVTANVASPPKNNTPSCVPVDIQMPSTLLSPSDDLQARQESAEKMKRAKLRKKPRQLRSTFDQRFQPAEPEKPLSISDSMLLEHPLNQSPFLFTRERWMPDEALLHGRLFVGVWEMGLENVDEEAVQMVHASISHLLKNILSAVARLRKGFRMRGDRFMYQVGVEVPSPWLQSTSKLRLYQEHGVETEVANLAGDQVYLPPVPPPKAMAEQNHAFAEACGAQRAKELRPVSLFDLWDALQVHKNMVPSQAVYSLAMEQIASAMWHPGHEELQRLNLKLT